MSDNDIDNIVKFRTSANEDDMPMPDETVPQPPTPEQLQQAQQQNGEQILQLIKKNRKVSHENLQRSFESLESVLDSLKNNRQDGALFVKKDSKDKVYFSLEDVIRTVMKGLGACLTSMEANNSLLDMLVHDFGGVIHNIDQTQRSMLVANSHTQVLLEVLKEKGVISESEMKETWERLVKEKQEQAKKTMSSE